MQNFEFFSIIFAIITFFHYLSLKLQSRYQIYTIYFDKKAFTVHFIFTSLLWIVWLILFFILSPNNPSIGLPFYNQFFVPMGIFTSMVGLILIIWSGCLLGLRRAWGIRYFEKNLKNKIERRGPYKYLNNPIYDGFVLYSLGKALTNNSFIYLLISLECYLFFNVFLSSFENKEVYKKF